MQLLGHITPGDGVALAAAFVAGLVVAFAVLRRFLSGRKEP